MNATTEIVNNQTRDDIVVALDDALEKIGTAVDEIRFALREAASIGIHDNTVETYSMPQLEGREGGWCGTNAIDHVRDLRDTINAMRAACATDRS